MEKIAFKIYPMLLVIASFTLEAKPPIPTPTIGIGSFSSQDVWGGQWAVGVQFDELATGYVDYQSSDVAKQLSLMVDRQFYLTRSLSLVGSVGSTFWLNSDDIEEVVFEPLLGIGVRYDWSPYVATSVGYRYPVTQEFSELLEPSIQLGVIVKPFNHGKSDSLLIAAEAIRPVEALPEMKKVDMPVEGCKAGIFIRSFYFAHDSATSDISRQDIALIQALDGTRYTVIGHTDSLGSSDYNQKLGLKRAEFVKQVLQENGVHEAAVFVCSRGEAEASEEKMRTNNALQRRVDIYFIE
ncbi:OmpA family protein [Vibrio scophthalmi]|uniref:OmpA family protein n=1 Tax=Vibrio scophthalmi TaxID=45658 RepID=UPI003EC1556E